MMQISGRYRHLIRFRNEEFVNILLLISGGAISIFGTRIYNFAISYYILQTTGSALAFSISMAVGTIPRILISPFAGAIVDELDRKKIVIFMDLGRCITLMALYFITISGNIQLMNIYITTLMLNTMDIFFNIASGSSIPNIVHKENIVRINSINQAASSASGILGPAVGGIIICFISIKFFILINALSFLISGISQCFINYNINNMPVFNSCHKIKLSVFSILKNTQESLKYIKSQDLIIMLTVYSMLGNFLLYLGFIIPLPYLILKCFNLNSAQYGIIQGSMALGSVTFSVLLSIIHLRDRKLRLIMYSSLLLGAVFLMLGAGTIINTFIASKIFIFIYMVSLGFIFATSVVLVNIPTNAIQQEKIDNSYLGRVLGFQNTFSCIISPAAMLLSGKLLGIVKPYTLPVISGIIFIVYVLIMCSGKTMKSI